MIKMIDVSYKDIITKVTMTFPKSLNYIYVENGAGKSTLLDCISGLNTS
ncbi:AAA family ATPase [Bacillaceae bacterium SIJ1]|nr:AAA family ATPase [Litoribacterium kuwaitense]